MPSRVETDEVLGVDEMGVLVHEVVLDGQVGARNVLDAVPLAAPGYVAGDEVAFRGFGLVVENVDQLGIPLAVGWNLISIPMEIDNSSINAVFPDASDGDDLYGYDGDWITATYYAGYGWHGELSSMQPGKGYWYRANAPFTWEY